MCVCVFVQIRQRVSTEATFNKAKLTKLIGERWLGSDVLDWNLRIYEEKRDNKRVVCMCVRVNKCVYLKNSQGLD